MIRETEKRLLPGAACAVLFVHGILGSPAQFAPFLPLVPQDWSFCNLLLQGHGGGAAPCNPLRRILFYCQTGLWGVIFIRHTESPIFILFSNSTSTLQANACSKRTLL